MRVNKLIGTDHTKIFERENGIRFMASVIGEIAFEQQWNAYFILEGAPFQEAERAVLTHLFAGSMPSTDYRIYARAGITYKF